jgi:actin-like ATPase involved in cell morphogenesis
VTDVREGIFGIDLGTTYSVVSYIDGSGKPVVVKNMLHDQDTTPSVVFFENDSNVVVGTTAKESAVLAPDQVISMVKRQMGNKDWHTTQFGKEYDAPTISALILGAMSKDAEAYTGRKVDKVVITVPAYFGMLEKQATRQAGEIAGLDVVEVVPEPVAAAFSYGLGSDSQEKTILVYDLGGGTFDITLIKLTAGIEVVVVDGNHLLGGRDWDEALFNHLAEAAVRELGDENILEDPQFVQDLWNRAEETKKRLSQTESRSVILRAGGASAKVTVTRAEFEQMTAHLVEQTVEITKRALATAEEKEPGIAGKITDVILVGGSSLMPVISQTLTKEFGWDTQLMDPHLAVARGAALYAAGAVVRQWSQEAAQEQAVAEGGTEDSGTAGLAEVVPTEEQVETAVEQASAAYGIEADELAEIAKVKVSSALPKAVGVKLVDTDVPGWQELLQNDPDPLTGPFYVKHLVPPQTSLPFDLPEPFIAQTVVSGQDQIEIELWEQAGGVPGRSMAENTHLQVKEQGGSRITGLQQYGLPENAPIHLYLSVTAEGIVTLRAFEPTSKKELKVTATIALLSEEEVEQAKQLYSGLTAGT